MVINEIFITLGLFLTNSVLHIFACYTEKYELKKYTRFLLMPLLLIAVFAMQNKFDPILFLALVSLGAADYFLFFENSETPKFCLGIICYFTAAVIYLTDSVSKIYFPLSILYIILGLIILTGGVIFLFIKFKQHLGKLRPVYFVYFLVLSLFAVSGFAIACEFPSVQNLFLSVGSFLFLISNGLLFYNLFITEINRSDFYIMFIYILSQFLIVMSYFILPF